MSKKSEFDNEEFRGGRGGKCEGHVREGRELLGGHVCMKCLISFLHYSHPQKARTRYTRT